MKYYLIIPARFKSKRLPGKPLKDICGIPMIIRTFKQCEKIIDRKKIIVATDNKKIKIYVKNIKFK